MRAEKSSNGGALSCMRAPVGGMRGALSCVCGDQSCVVADLSWALAAVWGSGGALGCIGAVLKGMRGVICCAGGAGEGCGVPLIEEVDAGFASAPLTRCLGVSSLPATNKKLQVGVWR